MKALFYSLSLALLVNAHAQVIDMAETQASSELYSDGSLCLELKDYQKAKKYFLKAIDLYKQNPDYFFGLGLAQYHLNELDPALTNIRTAISLDPNQATYYYQEGAILYLFSSYENARKSFEQAIVMNATSAIKIDRHNTLFQIGVCKMKTDDYYGAIKTFDQIISEKPDYEKAILNRGIALANTQQFEKACDDFSQAATRNFERGRELLEKYCYTFRTVVVKN